MHVAAWVEGLQVAGYEIASVKQHLAVVRMLFDYLVTGGSPCGSVKGPRHSVRRGKTPVLDGGEASKLLDRIPANTVVGLHDRALIGLMTYTFARIDAAVAMSVADVYHERNRLWVRLREKGGKRHEMPCHHTLEEYLTGYIEAAGLVDQPDTPLFRTIDRVTKQLSGKRLMQAEAWHMVNRRAKAAGVKTAVCNHTVRGTGITTYLENGACSSAPTSWPTMPRPRPRSSTTGATTA